MSLEPEPFRNAMSRLASGVTVVVTRDDQGRCFGMTATAVCSLSLEPPLVLVCVDRKAAMHGLILRAPVFGLSVLAEGQEATARRFADPARHAMDESGGPAGPAGLPGIRGALAHLECERGAVHPGGDHSIVTGTVAWAATYDGAPLVHFRSRYGTLAP